MACGAHQVVRPEAKRIVLDLAAASRALDCASEFSGRADTRERDIHFEKAIQWIVNSTDWMPADALTAIPRQTTPRSMAPLSPKSMRSLRRKECS